MAALLRRTLLLQLCTLLHCLQLLNVMRATQATTIYVVNQCSSTVCAKYFVPSLGGACSELAPGATWTVSASSSWVGGTMWAIANTGCSGQACNTGPPSGVSQFEITVASSGGNDYYDISVLAGFNIPMKVVPTNGACPTVDCQGDSASACPEGFYTGGPDKTKACGTGTDYNLYLCA